MEDCQPRAGQAGWLLWPAVSPVPPDSLAAGAGARRADGARRLFAANRAARFETAVLLVAGTIGVAARFFPASPLWLDEALSVNIADQPLGRIDDALRRDGHPPLYYYALSLWMKVFGTGDTAVRLLSVLLGMLTIVLVVAVCRKHGQRALSTLAAFVIAVSPYAVRYSSETRMYSMVMALVLLGWLALMRAADRPTVARLAPVAVVSGALMLTHYWAFFLLAAVGALALMHAWFVPSDRSSHTRIAIAIAAGGVFFVPWLSAFFYQMRHTGTPWATRSWPPRVVSESLVDFSGGLDPEAILLMVTLSLLVALGVFGRRDAGVLTLRRTQQPWVANATAVMAGTVALGGAVSFVSDSAFAGRYAAVFFPIFAVLVALGIAVLESGWVRTGAVAAVALFSLAQLYHAADRDRTQAGSIGAIINDSAVPGDLVVVCPDQLGPALRRAVRPDIEMVAYPDLSSPRFVNWVDYAARHAGVEPDAVARGIVAQVSPERTVWLTFAGGYRGLDTQCDRLVDALARLRPRTELLESPDGAKYFETSALRRYDSV